MTQLETRSKARPRSRTRRRRAKGTSLGGLDKARAHRQMVHARALDTIDCEIDLRPGGMFRTIMRSPEGKDFPNIGCYLEVVPNERLVWTDALLPGYRPSEKPFFTAVIALEKQGNGTRYTATAIHRDEAGRKQHEEMGFHRAGERLSIN